MEGVGKMEVISTVISEKELKLLLSLLQDDLKEAQELKDIDEKNERIGRVIEHMQRYIED